MTLCWYFGSILFPTACIGYVLEVEGAAVPNAKLILNHCPDMQDKIQQEQAEQERREKEEAQAQIDAELLAANT